MVARRLNKRVAKLFHETGLPNAVLKQGGRIFNETGLPDLYEKW
jgi:hypothetical protein